MGGLGVAPPAGIINLSTVGAFLDMGVIGGSRIDGI